MGTPVGPLVDELLLRVRDPQATAHTREHALLVLTHAQRALNAGTNAVLGTFAFTLDPRRLLYTLSGFGVGNPEMVRVIDVRVQGTRLNRTTWDAITRANLYWMRALGQPRAWARFGRDLLLVYPAAREEAMAAELTYTKVTRKFVLEDEEVEVSRELIPRMLDLAEALLHVRARQFKTAAIVGQRLGGGTASAQS